MRALKIERLSAPSRAPVKKARVLPIVQSPEDWFESFLNTERDARQPDPDKFMFDARGELVALA